MSFSSDAPRAFRLRIRLRTGEEVDEFYHVRTEDPETYAGEILADSGRGKGEENESNVL